MIKRFFFFLVAVVSFLSSGAQQDTAVVPQRKPGLRISLLTCGPGEEVYETFGHTAVRIVDSNVQGPLSDLVYNYGMFNGYDENFEMKFMRGKLLYYVATNLYGDFMEEYTEYGRTVQEQVLLVSDSAKEEIKYYLQTNVLPENRYYKYDFFFDNCATRIRDIFPRTLGDTYVYGKILPAGHHITFRDIINEYFYSLHWTRLGVNILLGSKIDKVMTDMDIMFLPSYLRDGLAGATVNGLKVATPPELILPGTGKKPAGINQPLIVTCLVFVLTTVGLTVRKLRVLGRIMSALLLVVSGLLGWLMLAMWFGTDHQGCANNYNVLWALPLNLFIAFAKPRRKSLYAIIAILFIITSLVLHLLHIQGIIPEFLPLLLSLLLVHGNIYRQSKAQTTPAYEK